MGQANQRKAAFLAAHPICYFCGTAPATTIEHMPPRVAFPKGLHPEGYEFPACQPCNNNHSRLEQVAALYVTLFDHEAANLDEAHLLKLMWGVFNNNIDAMPMMIAETRAKRQYVRDTGLRPPAGTAISELPLAHVPEAANRALLHFTRKLTCALHYRAAGQPLARSMQMRTFWTPIHLPAGQDLFAEMADRMSFLTIGARPNVEIGNRFNWIWHLTPAQDVFAYCAVFGASFMFFGGTAPASGAANDPHWVSHELDDNPKAVWNAVEAASHLPG